MEDTVVANEVRTGVLFQLDNSREAVLKFVNVIKKKRLFPLIYVARVQPSVLKVIETFEWQKKDYVKQIETGCVRPATTFSQTRWKSDHTFSLVWKRMYGMQLGVIGNVVEQWLLNEVEQLSRGEMFAEVLKANTLAGNFSCSYPTPVDGFQMCCSPTFWNSEGRQIVTWTDFWKNCINHQQFDFFWFATTRSNHSFLHHQFQETGNLDLFHPSSVEPVFTKTIKIS